MTDNRRLFREEAFARRGKSESLDGLLRVTAPHEWILLFCLGLGVLGLAVWGLFGSVGGERYGTMRVGAARRSLCGNC